MRKARVIVDAYCDVCTGLGDDVEGYVLLAFKGTEIGTRKARLVDLCGLCASKSIEPALVLMKMTRSTVTETPAVSTEDRDGQAARKVQVDWTCPLCNQPLRRNSVIDHLVMRHGATRIEQPKRCPECGKEYSKPTTMGLHRSTAHRFSMVQAHLDQLTSKAKAKRS